MGAFYEFYVYGVKWNSGENPNRKIVSVAFSAANVIDTANENKPYNIQLTPLIAY